MHASVFPGQGSQFVGMGKELYKSNKDFANIFNLANEILGYNIADIIFYGSEEDIKKTEISQLAIYIYSVALIKGLEIKPQGVAGHSLGEFSALTAAKALNIEEGILLVNERALAMKKASEITNGKMAAILGLETLKIEKICNEINEVFIANFNCPGQVVISGTNYGVDKAIEILKIEAKKVIELKVSGAFHTKYMKSAKEKLKKNLTNVKIKQPICPIYQNFTAKQTIDPDIIKENLANQITGPVLWTQTIENMINDGYNSFEEFGPGKVLKGLITRINKNVNITNAILTNA